MPHSIDTNHPPGRPSSAHPPGLSTLDDMLAALLARAQPLGGDTRDVETVSIFDADGRVLAHDLVAGLMVPPQDVSAMDGYALRCADLPAGDLTAAVLPVSQRIPAGSTGQPLAPGSCARIFTGAPVPPGADAVVMQEDAESAGEAAVRLRVAPRPGQHIRRAGEDVMRGSVILARGRRLDPAALGVAAGIGCAEVPVIRRLRVALLSTGDELVMPGAIAPQDMPPGRIYNSNRYFLRALLKRLGCTVTDLGAVADRPEATREALRTAASGHDLIVCSGGVSVGEEDHVKAAVQALGHLELWQLAIKPGKPFAYGRVQDTHFIGLPGNPVSSFVTFVLLARPFILRLGGVQRVEIEPVLARAGFAWPRADRRREFLRVRRAADGTLALFDNQGSGVLTSMAWADGLVDNPPGQAIAPGDAVRYLPLPELLA